MPNLAAPTKTAAESPLAYASAFWRNYWQPGATAEGVGVVKDATLPAYDAAASAAQGVGVPLPNSYDDTPLTTRASQFGWGWVDIVNEYEIQPVKNAATAAAKWAWDGSMTLWVNLKGLLEGLGILALILALVQLLIVGFVLWMIAKALSGVHTVKVGV